MWVGPWLIGSKAKLSHPNLLPIDLAWSCLKQHRVNSDLLEFLLRFVEIVIDSPVSMPPGESIRNTKDWYKKKLKFRLKLNRFVSLEMMEKSLRNNLIKTR